MSDHIVPTRTYFVVFGILKVSIGLDRHRPVGFLIALLAVTAVVAVIFVAIPVRRSRARTTVTAG